jgi:quercetin dioxygenase-like cupin family protein
MRRLMWLAVSLSLACSPSPPQLLLGTDTPDLDDFVRRHPLAHDANIRADEVGRMPGATVHLVQVRGGEAPHRHDHHDMVVTVLRGRGVLRRGDSEHRMRAGDVAAVRRGEPHWFTNRGGEPSVALVVFAPPLDAPDMTPLDVDSPRQAR